MRKRSLSVRVTKLHFTIGKQFESQAIVILNLCFWKPSEACSCTALASPLAPSGFSDTERSSRVRAGSAPRAL